MAGILARKLEMTRIVKNDKFIPITLLEVPKIKVVGFKTTQKDGYDALILGIVSKKAPENIEKKKFTLSKKYFSEIKEFPIKEDEKEKYKVGDEITLKVLEGVEKVEIVGYSKGKGFTGAMKKHNFHGGPAGHGSKFHRALGSIGNRKPTRTHKGKKMHGHHGNILVHLKKIPLELLNEDISVIGVRGAVPGARKSIVNIIF